MKILENQDDATTSEILGVKEAIKHFRDVMKKLTLSMEELSLRDVGYNPGKALCAAWNKDAQTLGELKFCPRLKNGTIRKILTGKPEKVLCHLRPCLVTRLETLQTMISI